MITLLSFGVDVEDGFPLALRAVVGKLRIPIAGHVDLDLGAIAARPICPFDCATGVHLHSGHVHVQVELHVADIDELTIAIAKFEEDLVIACVQLTFGSNEIDGKIVDVLCQEWRT